MNTQIATRGRAATITLWILQIALGVMFLFAGGSKLAGAPAMVALFDTIGVGQWFRYVTGAIELGAGLALFLPAAAVFGALLLIATMIGAVVANLLLGQTPVPPLVLLAVAATIAWVRRRELPVVG